MVLNARLWYTAVLTQNGIEQCLNVDFINLRKLEKMLIQIGKINQNYKSVKIVMNNAHLMILGNQQEEKYHNAILIIDVSLEVMKLPWDMALGEKHSMMLTTMLNVKHMKNGQISL